MTVQVTLAGAAGSRTTTVNARGFVTRHIRTRPVANPVAKPKTEPTNLTALLAKVDRIMGINQ